MGRYPTPIPRGAGELHCRSLLYPGVKRELLGDLLAGRRSRSHPWSRVALLELCRLGRISLLGAVEMCHRLGDDEAQLDEKT